MPSGMEAIFATVRPLVKLVPVGRSPVGSFSKSVLDVFVNVGRTGTGLSLVRTIRRACGSLPPPPPEGPSPLRPPDALGFELRLFAEGRVTPNSTSSPSRNVTFCPSTSPAWKNTRFLPFPGFNRRATAAAFFCRSVTSLSYSHLMVLVLGNAVVGVAAVSGSFSSFSSGSSGSSGSVSVPFSSVGSETSPVSFPVSAGVSSSPPSESVSPDSKSRSSCSKNPKPPPCFTTTTTPTNRLGTKKHALRRFVRVSIRTRNSHTSPDTTKKKVSASRNVYE